MVLAASAATAYTLIDQIPSLIATDIAFATEQIVQNNNISTLQFKIQTIQYHDDTSGGYAPYPNIELSSGDFAVENMEGAAAAVTLSNLNDSTFLYGSSASGNISTSGKLTSTNGPSQVAGLLVNSDAEITNELICEKWT